MEFLTLDKIIEQEEKDSGFRVKQIFEKRKKINIEKDRQKLLAVILDALKRHGNINIESGDLPHVSRFKQMPTNKTVEVVPGVKVMFRNIGYWVDGHKYNFVVESYFSKKRFNYDQVTLQDLELTVEQMIHEARLVQYLMDQGFESIGGQTLKKYIYFERQFINEGCLREYRNRIKKALIRKLTQHPLIQSVISVDGRELRIFQVEFKDVEHNPLILQYIPPYEMFDYEFLNKKLFSLEGGYNNPALPMLNLLVVQIISEVEKDLQGKAILSDTYPYIQEN